MSTEPNPSNAEASKRLLIGGFRTLHDALGDFLARVDAGEEIESAVPDVVATMLGVVRFFVPSDEEIL